MNSKQKGKRGELEFVNWLKARGHDARRGQQFKGGTDSPDIISSTLDAYHPEIKFTERLKLYEAVEQAKSECGNKYPVVFHRRNRGEWLAVMTAEDWLKLVDKIRAQEV